ncbi:hypothetical protein PTSG_08628 [Salpingoeca rosetta]|uniref:Protein-serine/threonine kinase n=1 Tax=Salpingoeca rosetta (strain ATCC 50818 / BSB-021) TaxID=946362 RepID=F2UK82_SALR5|nr:uncharacterized protein PTSG_08628 [Salpingoeca rosetta]EGD77531.1 hypothetical protein PTSG_08628 [Salpingoeca rosetta]|eukprot:XP_004990419.1 hypothetical protein PTSG_08628 [Salpingoeca rosetta]
MWCGGRMHAATRRVAGAVATMPHAHGCACVHALSVVRKGHGQHRARGQPWAWWLQARRPMTMSPHSESAKLAAAAAHAPPMPRIQTSDKDTDAPKELSFYNRNIRDMARKPTHALSVNHLWQLAEKEDPPHESAKLLSAQLLPRIAQRLLQFQQLPFIVGSNPYIKHVHIQYYDAFHNLFMMRKKVLKPNFSSKYTDFLRSLVEPHLQVARVVARGLAESVDADLIDAQHASTFMRDLIRSRITIRLLLEHHLALVEKKPNHAGIIDLQVNPHEVARACVAKVTQRCSAEYGRAPTVVFDGNFNFHIAMFRHHLEYILLEVLKNAFDATARRHAQAPSLPPVRITMSHVTSFFTIRVSDEGGGIPRDKEDHLWAFSFHPHEMRMTQQRLEALTSAKSLRGLGVGLPMSRLYAEFLDGDLDVKSVHGFGSDAFLTLPCLEAHQHHLLE